MSTPLDADSRFMILPIEGRARELDAKLLMALEALTANFQVILTQKWIINVNFHKIPRGIFVFKTLNEIDANVMRVAGQIGHTVVSWDDEGPGQIIHDKYLKSIVDSAVDMSRRVYAWGPNQVDALSNKYPEQRKKFVASGNPRWDLYRPEYRGYYAAEAKAIRDRFGSFVLINTNFAFFNSVITDFNEFMDIQKRAGFLDPAVEEDMRMALEIRRHEKGVLKSFLELIPALSAAFPDKTIIIRPHPTENRKIWKEIAEPFSNVQVVQEGSVVPWLMAAEVVIQNGCTTGVEAFTLERPVLSYCKHESDTTDWHLANHVCPRARDEAHAIALIREFIATSGASFKPYYTSARPFLEKHISALSGPSASAMIVRDSVALAQYVEAAGQPFDRKLDLGEGLVPFELPTYQQIKFPRITVDEMKEKIRVFVDLDPRFAGVGIEEIGESCFYLKRTA